MTYDLQRFHNAQASEYARALAELQAGRKRGHWIWYVLPQLEELGRSDTARFYGLEDDDEARAYLADAVLRGRLLACLRAVAGHLRAGVAVRELMGSSIDALKLVSSATLFAHVAAEEHAEVADAACDVLALAERQGIAACQPTLAILRRV